MARKPRLTDEFGIAESLGEIHTMPEEVTKDVETKQEEVEVIDSPDAFRIAVGHAEMEGKNHIEVSERLFKYLVKNSKTRYITYGDGGIKVYKVGTKEENDKIDSMTAEQYIEYVGQSQGKV